MAVQVVIEAGILKLFGGQAIQIGVNKTKSSPVLMNKSKGGATDHRRLSKQPFGDAAYQGGFSRSKFSAQSEHFASLEKRAETLSQTMRLSWRPQQHAQGFTGEMGFRGLADRRAQRNRRFTGAW
jgi:MOSC domain-containing protein YiiM